MKNKQELWESVLAQIQLEISEASFATWFKGTKIDSKNKDQVTVKVPNTFVKEWLQQKYHNTIFKLLKKKDQNIKKIDYAIDRSSNPITRPVTHGNGARGNRTSGNRINNQLDLQNFKISQETGLNPRYTFDNFIVGPFNELPQAAAWAAAKNPGQVYNPLFIYGEVGLGKTHLLEAIGNEIVTRNPDQKVRYIPSEKFISSVVNSIKNQKMPQFKSEFRTIDVLLVDDVQFMAGKEKTQEEFFHTFNVLYEKNKQIVVSSDAPPKAISALTERLRSRFEGGMIADIGLPDFETRVAILESKLQQKQSTLPQEIISFVASNIKNNIRELEGALNCLIAHQKVNDQPLTEEKTEQLLERFLQPPQKKLSPESILKTVARFYDLEVKNLKSKSRKREFARARQSAVYVLREMLDLSYPAIGRRLGGRDHTTIIYSYNKVQDLLEKKKDPEKQREIKLIKSRITG